MKIEAEYFTRLVNNQDHVFTTPIQPGDFEALEFRMGMAELKKQIQAGTVPDIASIAMAIPEYASALFATNSMSRENFDHYEKLLVEAIQERRLSKVINIIGSQLGKGKPTSELIRDASMAIESCRVDGGQAGKSFYECLSEFTPILEERYRNRGRLPGITTGFSRLDEVLGGFQPQIYFIGARPSQGKTALLLSMIRAALKAGKRAVMMSLESSQNAIIQRVLSAEATVPMNAIKTGNLTPGHFSKMTPVIDTIKGWNGNLDFAPTGDLATLERSCHSYVKGHGVEIIFIDYLQRITAPGRTKWEEVAAATRMLTNLSRVLNVPIICMAQTSREADHEIPQISHFQHSSQIEQDADVAMIIRHVYTCGCGRDCKPPSYCISGKEASYLIILKNRDGDVGHIPVIFDREHVKFLTDGEK